MVNRCRATSPLMNSSAHQSVVASKRLGIDQKLLTSDSLTLWRENGNSAPRPPKTEYRLYIECWKEHDWPLWSARCYLRLRTVQHQIIEFAEDALLQLVPGDIPVLVHEKWRAEPEEEQEEKRRLRLSGCFTLLWDFCFPFTWNIKHVEISKMRLRQKHSQHADAAV